MICEFSSKCTLYKCMAYFLLNRSTLCVFLMFFDFIVMNAYIKYKRRACITIYRNSRKAKQTEKKRKIIPMFTYKPNVIEI